MMSGRDSSNPVVLRRLATVVHTRLSGAERAMQRELHTLRKIEWEVRARQGKVEGLCEDLRDLQKYLAGQCGSSVGSSNAVDYQLGLRRRFWIDYDLQRERYYLDMTHEEHAAQIHVVMEKRKTFSALKYQYDNIAGKLRCARMSRDVRRILKEDAERQNQ